MSRPIKFRQPIFEKGKFKEFHYWGIIDLTGEGKPQWVGPLTNVLGVCDVADSRQFTGLTDKNGAEIFEGDFLKAENFDKEMQVIWRADLCSFALSARGWMYDHYFGEGADAGRCEVTHNIHEK
jgi:hypothetical protein